MLEDVVANEVTNRDESWICRYMDEDEDMDEDMDMDTYDI